MKQLVDSLFVWGVLLTFAMGATEAAETKGPNKHKYLDVTLDVSVPLKGAGCEGIAVGKEFIYVVDGTTNVMQLKFDGSIEKTWSIDASGSRFRGIDHGPKNNLVLIDSKLCKIVVIDLQGAVQQVIQLPQSRGYRAISYFDGFFVSDRTKAELIKFDHTGKAVKRLKIDVDDVQGVDMYHSNRVWYMDDNVKLLKHKDYAQDRVVDAIDLTKVSRFKDPEGLDYDERSEIVYMCYDGDKHIIGLYVGGKAASQLPAAAN